MTLFDVLATTPWLLVGGVIFFLAVEAEKAIIRSSPGLRETPGSARE